MAKKIIQIAKAKTELSKPQKEFNRLIKKIEKLETELKDFREGMEKIQQKMATDLLPIKKEYLEQRKALAVCYDRAYDSGFFKKTETKKLTHIITEICLEVLEEEENEEMERIYDKYNQTSYKEETAQAEAEQADMLKNMFSMFGIDMEDDIDLKDPAKFQAQMAQKMAEQRQLYEEQQRQAEERRARRPKTQKQLEREQKKELEARSITKSVRTIYMDLVKAFHPDRETDPAERDRKTQIMQRVTEAYEKNDLLALLRLQLEFERIDQEHIESLAEDQLKNYNKLLRDQTQELEYELEMMKSRAAMMIGQPPYMTSSIWSLQYALDKDISEFKQVIKNIKRDLKSFEDYTALKHYLKNYKIPKPGKDDNPFDFLF
ncbi:MAG: hypothetical protein ACK4GN_11025 [Runella sp.]